MRIQILSGAFIAFFLCFVCLQTKYQVTTATISGNVTNAEGKGLGGASVKVLLPMQV
ncbi:MAG: hypothetical protein ACR2KX_04520 [Chitinophagaceae bacterium]